MSSLVRLSWLKADMMTAKARSIEQLGFSRWSYSGVVLAILVALGVWVLDVTGTLHALDGWAYDVCFRAKSHMVTPPARVLLVHVDPQDVKADPSLLSALAHTLHDLEARHLVLGFHPPRIPTDLARLARETDQIVLGRECDRDPVAPDRHRLRPIPPGGEGMPQAILYVPSVHGGIYRAQVTAVDVAHQNRATVEAMVAQRLVGPTAVSDHSFRIDFRGGPGSLPHVTSQSVLAGDVVRELVAGRVVLLGIPTPGIHPGIATPTTHDAKKMSLLEFHGHALNTLLNARAIRDLGPCSRLLLFLFITLVSLVIFQHSELRLAVWVSSVMLLVEFLAAIAMLRWSCYWLPCVPMAITQSVSCALIFTRKSRLSALTVRRLLLSLSGELRRRRWPTGFFSTAEPWSQVASFMYQTLNLNRLIILELPRNRNHLREVKAINCGFSDIDEQRRDYRRWPYSAAHEAKGPYCVDGGRTYLKAVGDDEEQYLTPLLFGGELFGFLALGVPSEQRDATPEFLSALREFADQVAEMLYRRRCILAEQRQGSLLRRVITRVPEEDAYGELVHATHLLEQRLTRLEHMFDVSDTASAIYDVFGRLLMINTRMSELLRSEGIVPSELTTVDLLAKLTRRDLDDARHLLRHVILEKQKQSVPITFAKQTGAFQLFVRPLELEVPHAGALPNEAAPFQLQGVACEVVDRTSILEAYELKERLAENLGHTLRNDLAAIEFATSLLAAEGLGDDDREQYGQLIHEKVHGAVDTLEQCERFLTMDVSSDSHECFPIDPLAVLERAIQSVDAELQEHQIAPQIDHPDLTGHVMADPQRLEQAFRAALEVLVSNARDDTELRIQVAEELLETALTFENQGYGASPEQLRHLLDRSQETTLEEFQQLRDAVEWVENWGGRMAVSSEIGKGVSVKLVLQRFH